MKTEIEEILFEMEQTTATLGIIQTAFAEGEGSINTKEASNALFLLYTKQNNALEGLRKVISQ